MEKTTDFYVASQTGESICLLERLVFYLSAYLSARLHANDAMIVADDAVCDYSLSIKYSQIREDINLSE